MKKRKIIIAGAILGCCLWMMFGCSVAGRLQRHRTTASLSQLTRTDRQQRQQDSRPQVVKLQRDSDTFYLAPVDTLADGERVMSVQIEQVTERFNLCYGRNHSITAISVFIYCSLRFR